MGVNGKKRARVILLILSIYLFLVAIKLMGGAFEFMGGGIAETIIETTTNPLLGFVIGILATSLVQSSSGTTSIVVALAGGGVLSLETAIPIVIGANIGTSVTNLIVSMAHILRRDEFERAFAGATVHDFFNWLAALVFLPLQIYFGLFTKIITAFSGFVGLGSGITFTSPVSYIVSPITKPVSSLVSPVPLIVLSLILLFLALKLLVSSTQFLFKSTASNFISDVLFKNPLRAFGIGLLFTAIIQSSSITTSLIIPLVGAGMLTLEKIYPYTLGANIGTTVTAILAALVFVSPIPIMIALAHLLFNFFGILVWYPLRAIPIKMAKKMGYIGSRHKFVAIGFIVILFYILPILLLLASGGI